MAFNIAISGIQAASADLSVVGNNIANSSTTGFKGSRAEFADVYAVSNLGTSANAIGQGVQSTAVAQQFTQGNIEFTNNNLDMAINGQGFFTLDDNGSRLYMRAGAFGVNNNGDVVNASGQQLMAYQAVNGTITGALQPLQLSSANLQPQASANASLDVNLNASDSVLAPAFDATNPLSYNETTSLSVYDSLGAQHLAQVYFKKTASNSWDAYMTIDGDTTQTTTVQNLGFDSSGNLTTAMPISFGTYTPATGAAPMTLSVDLSGSTQVGADFAVNSVSQDGYTTGQLTGVSVDQNGMVHANYSNGQSQVQGQLALANFANPQGLQPASDSNWAETSASGVALVGAPGSSTLGVVQSGALEDSNVDLSTQLVNMIVAQRNFQANAQMVKTEDAVTQTIINLQ
jgi:flagellar hook protein FlgE